MWADTSDALLDIGIQECTIKKYTYVVSVYVLRK